LTAEPLGWQRYASYDLQNQWSAANMQVMAYIIRLQDDLGRELKRRREAAHLSKSALAQRAGKVREVIYRLEAGEDVTVSSLLAVMAALGLALRIDEAGLPTMEEVAARFAEDDEEGDDDGRTGAR
jgi:HTH-type transcriptional regulator / antitoxin HipB